jgi:hypothetical protein
MSQRTSKHYFGFLPGSKDFAFHGPVIPRIGEHVLVDLDSGKGKERFRVAGVTYEQNDGTDLSARVFLQPDPE